MEKLMINPEQIWQDKDFSEFKVLDGILIPRNGNLFIADVPLPQGWEELIEELSQQSQRRIIVVDAEELTFGLNLLLPPIEFFEQNLTTALFPGKGAKKVLEYLERTNPELINLLKKQGSLFEIQNEDSIPQWFDFGRYKKVIIVDDVVASGRTASSIATKVKDSCQVADDVYYTRGWRLPPTISVFSWLTLLPDKRVRIQKTNKYSRSSVYDVDRLNAVVCYQSRSVGIPPCNSLSTLIEGTGRSQAVISGLKEKYFPTEAFDQFISFLKQT